MGLLVLHLRSLWRPGREACLHAAADTAASRPLIVYRRAHKSVFRVLKVEAHVTDNAFQVMEPCTPKKCLKSERLRKDHKNHIQ